MLYQKRTKTVLFFILGLFIYIGVAEQALWAEEQGQINPGKTLALKIINKFKRGIMTDQGRFIVTSETKVYMEGNREISYDLLPAPCEAKVHYFPAVNSDQTAVKIIITDILPGAVRYFHVPAPE